MNQALSILRQFMVDEKIDYLLVNSTNKYLVEYNSLNKNSRYKLTNFSGSTGDALVTIDNVFLFVDGRYHIQADMEVDHNMTTVVKLQNGQKFLDEMINIIPKDATLGIFAQKVSQKTVEYIESQIKIKLIDFDPLDMTILPQTTSYEKIDENLCGHSTDDIVRKLDLKNDEALIITNLEELSYLFNLRDFSNQYSTKVKGKGIILKDNAIFFDETQSEDFEEYIKNLDKTVLIDKSSINAHEYSLIKHKAKELEQNPIALMKSIKTEAEIEHYIEAFNKTDKAVLSIREYIETYDSISEFDIARKLEEEFYRFGAKLLSFNSIVAKDKNSALAHYSKCSHDEILTDGSLILIDCGAYYEGGLATDITRVFVKGTPTALHKKIYTTVLKAFLNAYNTKIKDNISGYEIDNQVRKIFASIDTQGFVFNHGLGHGIGINVHEAPPNLSANDIAKTPLKENMCFTIEPGLYKENYFGVRLENSCYLKNGKINSFVHVPYEKKLIDFAMLTEQEKLWLNEFGVI